MKKALILLLTILPLVGFTQMDSLKFSVISLNDTTFHVGATFGKDYEGVRVIEFITKDKIEIDSLKKGLVLYHFKVRFEADFVKMKVKKQRKDSILKTMIGAPILDFDAPDTTGFFHRANNYRGRVLILHFWNFWDQSFENEIPVLNKMIEKYSKDGLAILSFMDNDIGKDEKEYLTKHSLSFTIIPNSRAFVSKILPISHSIPSMILVDKQGLMRYFYIEHELSNRKSDFYKDFEENNSFETRIVSLLRGQ